MRDPGFTPNLPAGAVQTYSIIRPRTPDFFRGATCEEVNCERRRLGWRSRADTSTPEGARVARWILNKSGRRFTKEEAGPILTFTFPPGQDCFERHKVAVEREPLYVVRGGDHRGTRDFRRTHKRGEDWRDDMQERLGQVAEAQKKG